MYYINLLSCRFCFSVQRYFEVVWWDPLVIFSPTCLERCARKLFLSCTTVPQTLQVYLDRCAFSVLVRQLPTCFTKTSISFVEFKGYSLSQTAQIMIIFQELFSQILGFSFTNVTFIFSNVNATLKILSEKTISNIEKKGFTFKKFP